MEERSPDTDQVKWRNWPLKTEKGERGRQRKREMGERVKDNDSRKETGGKRQVAATERERDTQRKTEYK